MGVGGVSSAMAAFGVSVGGMVDAWFIRHLFYPAAPLREMKIAFQCEFSLRSATSKIQEPEAVQSKNAFSNSCSPNSVTGNPEYLKTLFRSKSIVQGKTQTLFKRLNLL